MIAIFITLIGSENHAAHFEKATTAVGEGGGDDELEEDLSGLACRLRARSQSMSPRPSRVVYGQFMFIEVQPGHNFHAVKE